LRHRHTQGRPFRTALQVCDVCCGSLEKSSHPITRTSRVLTCPPHITYSPTPPHHTTRHHTHSRHVASVVRRCWSDVVGRVTRLRSGIAAVREHACVLASRRGPRAFLKPAEAEEHSDSSSHVFYSILRRLP